MTSLFRFHGGVHPPEHKAESNATPIRPAPVPPLLHIALGQSVGNAAQPCVSVGDTVPAGACLGRAEGRISVAVHAPVAGVVRAIAPHPFAHPSGLSVPTLTLEPNGSTATVDPQPLAWQSADPRSVLAHLRDQGVVGLGGAVFPTHLKLGGTGLDTLVVNGAECEPYLTCDDRLMRERAQDIVTGILIAAGLTHARRILVGIEDNKPEALAAMQHAASGSGIDVVAIPTLYPSGGAKQLIRILTGIEVPAGTRSSDLGVQCFNVATLYTLAQALHQGLPVTRRIVTLTGAVAEPGNVVSSPSLLLTIAYLAQSDAVAPMSKEVAELLVEPPVAAGFRVLPVVQDIRVSPYYLLDLKRRPLSPLAMRLRGRLAALSGSRVPPARF